MTKSMEGSGGGAGVPRPEGASRESVAVPPGLTLEELQMLNASPMAGLARSTGVAYVRYVSGYFQQWCDDRGVELEQVETAHLMAYLAEARRGGAPKGPVSVRWLRTTFSRGEACPEVPHVGTPRGLEQGGTADQPRGEEGKKRAGGRRSPRRAAPRRKIQRRRFLIWRAIGGVGVAPENGTAYLVWRFRPGNPEWCRWG